MIGGQEMSKEQPIQQQPERLNEKQQEFLQKYMSRLDKPKYIARLEKVFGEINETSELTPEQLVTLRGLAYNIVGYAEDGSEQLELDKLVTHLGQIRPVSEQVQTALKEGFEDLLINRELKQFRRKLAVELRGKFVAELVGRGLTLDEIRAEALLLDDIKENLIDEEIVNEAKKQLQNRDIHPPQA